MIGSLLQLVAVFHDFVDCLVIPRSINDIDCMPCCQIECLMPLNRSLIHLPSHSPLISDLYYEGEIFHRVFISVNNNESCVMN